MVEIKGGRITAKWADSRKRTPDQITELARDVITGRRAVVNNADAIKCHWFMLLPFLSFTRAAGERIFALVGDNNEIGPRHLNGYAAFLSMDVLHVRDKDAFLAELDRMRAALGLETESTEA